MSKVGNKSVWFTVCVAALGYFVDIYDIQVFRVVGIESLRDGLKIPVSEIPHYFNDVLFNVQMAGMLIGGLLFGVLGDKLGRKSILFSSILLYSLANIANAFVTNIEQYTILRFLAGFGLAGEIGAAITLTTEIMGRTQRGYGTMVIVAMGALGAVLAVFINKNSGSLVGLIGLQPWQCVYIAGGILGLLLLLLRFQTFESGMFDEVKNNSAVKKGDFFSLFKTKANFLKYLNCILVGLPVWFVIGVLIGRSPEIAKTNGVIQPVDIALATMFCYIGLSVGDIASGTLSQIFKNRKTVTASFIVASSILSLLFLFTKNETLELFYLYCFLCGAFTGFWALFVTIAAEQFGTNIRATVAITAPNFVRGLVIPITLSVSSLAKTNGIISACLWVGTICMTLSFVSILLLGETFGKDLNYYEPE